MTNRQARREQSRGNRAQRSRLSQQRPSQPSRGSGSSGGGPGGFFTLPYLIGVGALIVVLAGVLIFVAVNSSGNSEQANKLEEAAAAFPTDMAEGNVVGADDAPIDLTVWVDFRCVHCLRFSAEDEPGIIEEYVEPGHVRFEVKHLAVLGNESVNAARAAQCAEDQGQFWQMQNKLFFEHANEGSPSSGLFSADSLKGYASDLGLNRAEFDACYDNGDTLEEVNQQIAEAQSFGFTGTPAFLINGQPISGGGPASLEGWRQVFDGLLEEQGESGEGNGETNGEGNGETGADATATAGDNANGEASPAAEETP